MIALFLLLLLLCFLSFLMALITESSSKKDKQPPKQRLRKKQQSSWDQIKNLLTCKQIEGSTVHDPSKIAHNNHNTNHAVPYSKLGSSCSSICSFKDVVQGNTRVVHRADNSPDSSTVGQDTRLLQRRKPLPGSARGMQFRKLSGCYECHMIVDPGRYPFSPRTTICACSQCGEVFPKTESLELHQAVRHAVSELGPDDSGRNIVEIIFKSSWLKKESPIFKIERILKVHNTQRTIQRFEDCRDAVKARARANTRKNPRCAADGNELLRFHSTTLSCSLGARCSSSLCSSVPGCGVCTVIRHGFQADKQGVRTTASSGRAHDSLSCADGRRAMLVCRVIAGRVKRDVAAAEEDGLAATSYDSVAGYATKLEELIVYNPKAILACFVVIYKTLDS